MGIFRVVATSLFLIMFMYIGHQLIRFTDMSWSSAIVLLLGLGLICFMVISSFLFFWQERNLDHSALRDVLLNLSMFSMAYLNFLATLVILRDVYAFFEYMFSTASPTLYSTEATGVLLLIPAFLILLGHAVVRVGPRLVRIPILFTDLSEDLNQLRILHITDLHISPSLPASFVRSLVKQSMKTKPDIIVFTGDIMDSFIDKHAEEIEYLKSLQARYGIYFVPGNHEYYWDAPKSLQAFRDLGFKVLVNEVADVQIGTGLLQIAGVSDPAAEHFRQIGPDFDAINSQLKPSSFKILLSHQPSLVKKAQQSGFDLQLSGHTHGGQFFPWNFLIIFFERYSKGLYHLGKLRLYVNQGTGYWGPRLRLGTYCELAEIILRKG